MDATITTVNDNSAAHRASRPVARPSGESQPASDIPIVQMIGRFHADYTGPPPKYRRAYLDAVDAVFPALWRAGRWYVEDRNLPLIAKIYGLTPKNTKAA